MTEQQTPVSTAGFEGAVTHLSTGVWEEPGVRGRVLDLATVTHVPVGGVARGVLHPALRTWPGVFLLAKVLVSDGAEQEDAVGRPLLDAGNMEEREASGTTPYRLGPLDGGDADQTGDGSRLEGFTQVLTSLLEVLDIPTCLLGVGGER